MSTIKSKLEAFCQINSIEIPNGFYRGSPSKYAVVRKSESGWALTARTWFNVSDLIFYLDTYCTEVEYRIFDFAEGVELKRRGKKQVELLASIE